MIFWRVLARQLVYWAAVHATGPKFRNAHPDYISVSIALQRWL
jgi:hypothetical protein